MSRENVEVVRASWEAWNRGDMDALFEFYDPAVEWDMTHSYVPGMEVFHGHDGVRQFFREWREFFAEYYADAEEFIDADENVVVRVRQGAAEGSAASPSRCLPTGRCTGFARAEL